MADFPPNQFDSFGPGGRYLADSAALFLESATVPQKQPQGLQVFGIAAEVSSGNAGVGDFNRPVQFDGDVPFVI